MIYTVDNLYFGYDSKQVLAIDHLGFEERKIHVLLGPNGSGKTTLLKLLNRLLPLQKGEICFEGSSLEKDPTFREKTVYVHQNPLLLSGSVYENIAYGLKLRKMAKQEIESRVEEALSIVGLEGFEKRKNSALSGGETQRVAIARALVLKPTVLLFDEPTSSVDRENVGRIEQILLEIKENLGSTVIISTHNLPFAYRICDRLVHLEEGRVIPPSENIIKGTSAGTDSNFHIFKSGDIEIRCPLLEGPFSKAVIDYDRIILSIHPIESSAKNNFPGTVQGTTVCEDSGCLVDVEVEISAPADAGHLALTSRVTKETVEEMGLKEGVRVWTAFKTSSVRLY